MFFFFNKSSGIILILGFAKDLYCKYLMKQGLKLDAAGQRNFFFLKQGWQYKFDSEFQR